MDIAVSQVGEGAGTLVKLVLSGRLDTAGVGQIETRFTAATVAAGRDAIVDLSAVELVTSMGIRMFISVARSMSQRHRRLVLFGARDLVGQVLDTAAIDSLVPHAADQAAAVALLRR